MHSLTIVFSILETPPFISSSSLHITTIDNITYNKFFFFGQFKWPIVAFLLLHRLKDDKHVYMGELLPAGAAGVQHKVT